jgi:hypothetical protein
VQKKAAERRSRPPVLYMTKPGADLGVAEDQMCQRHAVVGDVGKVETVGFRMMLFARDFLPLLRIDGGEKRVAVEGLVDVRDDQAVASASVSAKIWPPPMMKACA